MFRERMEHCLDNQGGFRGKTFLEMRLNKGKMTIGEKGKVATNNLWKFPNVRKGKTFFVK